MWSLLGIPTYFSYCFATPHKLELVMINSASLTVLIYSCLKYPSPLKTTKNSHMRISSVVWLNPKFDELQWKLNFVQEFVPGNPCRSTSISEALGEGLPTLLRTVHAKPMFCTTCSSPLVQDEERLESVFHSSDIAEVLQRVCFAVLLSLMAEKRKA